MNEITMAFVLRIPAEFMAAVDRLTESIDRLADAAIFQQKSVELALSSALHEETVLREAERLQQTLSEAISTHFPLTKGAPDTVSENPLPKIDDVPTAVAEPRQVVAQNIESAGKKTSFVAPAKQEKTWTAERDELLVRQKNAGIDLGDILLAVNKLLGPPVASEAACRTRYYSLQSTGYKLPEPKPAAKQSASAPKLNAAGEQVAPYDYVRQWAAERGLVDRHGALDFAVVNAKRKSLNLPPFAVIQGRAGAR